MYSRKFIKTLALHIAIAALTSINIPSFSYQGMPVPPLHVEGPYLKDPNGKNVTLHGYMQPGASWFNGMGHNYQDPKDFTKPGNVTTALNYYNKVADILTHTGPLYGKDHGWYCSFVRFIGDGSAPGNFAPGWDDKGKLVDEANFHAWIKNLLIPYSEHCKSNGLYVILCGNPSEVFPNNDGGRNMTQEYQQNLITYWSTLASTPGIKNADNVMFEICNEPICIESKFGANDWSIGDREKQIADFMQPIVDAIRAQGADNVIWIPGLGWQGTYSNFAKYPVNGINIGYAAHVYPGYGGAHDDAAKVEKLWNDNYKACADKYPMIITEMMWSPNDGQGYKDLFNASTKGFGNAIKSCLDKQGNVSYMCGMTGDFFSNLEQGLDKATMGTNDAVTAAFDWYPSYSSVAPEYKKVHAKQSKPHNKSVKHPKSKRK